MISELKLNLACGQNKVEGFFGIDLVKTEAADAAMDLEVFPWDIESESAEEIVCSHYVEHTPMETFGKRVFRAIKESKDFEQLKTIINQIDINAPSDGLIMFMDECYRIMKPGGKLTIVSPYYNSIRCWQDPTHRRAINEFTFLYFNKQWLLMNKLEHYGIKSDNDFTYGYDADQAVVSRNQEYRDFAFKHYMNTINDIHVVLTSRKSYEK